MRPTVQAINARGAEEHLLTPSGHPQSGAFVAGDFVRRKRVDCHGDGSAVNDKATETLKIDNFKPCAACRRRSYAVACVGKSPNLSRYQEWTRPYMVAARRKIGFVNESVATLMQKTHRYIQTFLRPVDIMQFHAVARLPEPRNPCIQEACACGSQGCQKVSSDLAHLRFKPGASKWRSARTDRSPRAIVPPLPARPCESTLKRPTCRATILLSCCRKVGQRRYGSPHARGRSLTGSKRQKSKQRFCRRESTTAKMLAQLARHTNIVELTSSAKSMVFSSAAQRR